MKTLRLASIAVQAESIRLNLLMRRLVIRAGLLAAAFFLVMMALVIAHAALFELLAARLSPAASYGILAGGDLVVALIVTLIALRSKPGLSEREAAEMGASARQEIRASFGWTKILMWAFTMFRNRPRKD